MNEQRLKATIAQFERAAHSLLGAKTARDGLHLEDELAAAFARVVESLCDNSCVAADFDYVDDTEPSNLETRITLRLTQLRSERRQIARDHQEDATGGTPQ